MIKQYIRCRIKLIVLYAAFVLIFTTVFFVYGMDMGAVAYGMIICTFIFLIFLAYDALKVINKIRKLDSIKSNLNTVVSHSFPTPCNSIEQQYQEIINDLYEKISENSQKLTSMHLEQIEYYTMWLHQVKTPLSAIRLALEADTENPKSTLYRQELFKIERYIEMALQFARLSDISGDLVIREYDLSEIVKQALKKYALLFSCNNLSVRLDPISQKVTTDSKWLSFIIEQLISNAVKYTQDGGIHIYCDNRHLVINDSGIGIREEDMARIFKKGYTGYNGRLDKRASGIGLYMAKRAADRLSVKILITSKLGAGTKVILEFPEKADMIE